MKHERQQNRTGLPWVQRTVRPNPFPLVRLGPYLLKSDNNIRKANQENCNVG